MAINLQGLLHNKPALIGLGVAGAAGLYVLVKRKQTTGSTSTDTGAAATGTSAMLPAYPNTTGTDVASWLGSQEGVLSAQNQQFLDQLSQTLGTSPAPTGGDTSTLPATSNVLGGWHVYNYLNDLNAGTPGLNLSYAQLVALNPGLGINTSSPNDPTFTSNQTVKIR